MIRVLLADDQSLVRAGFRMILSGEPGIEVVGEAGDGIAAVSEARALAPDVVLMDIRMPGLDGIEATRQIVAGQDPPRIVCSSRRSISTSTSTNRSAPARARSCSRTRRSTSSWPRSASWRRAGRCLPRR